MSLAQKSAKYITFIITPLRKKGYAEEIGAMYVETSAKDDLNVQDLFVQISDHLPPPPEVDSSVIRATAGLRKPQSAASGCC